MPAPSSSPQTPPLVLRIRNLGPLFNFKNSKLLTRGKLITDPALKKRMDAITRSFASQLRSAFPIAEGETRRDAWRRFSIVCLPHDDCWTAIPEHSVRCELVSAEHVGATLTIERIG